MRNKINLGVMIASFVITTGLFAQRPDRPMEQTPGRVAALDLTDEQQVKIQDLELKVGKKDHSAQVTTPLD